MPTSGKQILVVDDDQAIRETLSEVLEDEGYSVASAENGQDAMRYLRQRSPPSLILLDLMMPVMNGWQFRDEQLRDPSLSNIPVVVISADPSVRQRTASIAVDHCIRKPIDLEELLALVERYADGA
jgi:CheY-like chemotaxis protein